MHYFQARSTLWSKEVHKQRRHLLVVQFEKVHNVNHSLQLHDTLKNCTLDCANISNLTSTHSTRTSPPLHQELQERDALSRDKLSFTAYTFDISFPCSDSSKQDQLPQANTPAPAPVHFDFILLDQQVDAFESSAAFLWRAELRRQRSCSVLRSASFTTLICIVFISTWI